MSHLISLNPMLSKNIAHVDWTQSLEHSYADCSVFRRTTIKKKTGQAKNRFAPEEFLSVSTFTIRLKILHLLSHHRVQSVFSRAEPDMNKISVFVDETNIIIFIPGKYIWTVNMEIIEPIMFFLGKMILQILRLRYSAAKLFPL